MILTNITFIFNIAKGHTQKDKQCHTKGYNYFFYYSGLVTLEEITDTLYLLHQVY